MTTYNLYILPTPTGQVHLFTGINSDGNIVGTEFYYDYGFEDVNASYSYNVTMSFSAINDKGDIVGNIFEDNESKIALYENGIISSLPSFTLGYNPQPSALNNNGDIVGDYFTNTGVYGFIYKNGVYTQIAYPAAAGDNVSGINDAGQMVGYYALSGAGEAYDMLSY